MLDHEEPRTDRPMPPLSLTPLPSANISGRKGCEFLGVPGGGVWSVQVRGGVGFRGGVGGAGQANELASQCAPLCQN